MSYKESRSGKPQHAMLTRKQRDLLKNGGQGISKQTQRDHHEQIKRRVYNTILDFELLLEHWSESDRDEVFEDLVDKNGPLEQLADIFEFLYSAVGESGMFKHALIQGVRKAESEKSVHDFPHSIDVNFEVERSQKAGISAIEKYSRGPEGIESLTEREARLLIDALYVDDNLGNDSVVHAGLRFQKFLEGEEPEELKRIEEENKERIAEEIDQYRKNRKRHYEQRDNPDSDST